MSSDPDSPEGTNRTNIYTVAKRAGVSIATVSRALSNDSRVTQATRERVEAAATELGWEPPHARSQSAGATRTLALVFPDIVGPFYVEVVRAVEHAAHDAGYHITIYGTSVRGAHQLVSSLEFVSKIDGMIVMTTALTDGEIYQLHSRGLPLVLLGRSAPVPSLDVIQTTNFDGAHMATAHLIRHGHRRIAFIAGPPRLSGRCRSCGGVPRGAARA
jgi:LacI family transcriptional regulator